MAKREELKGLQLAEAAAEIMGWRLDRSALRWVRGDNTGACWVSDFYPDELPDADYLCLEWARENLAARGQLGRFAESLYALWWERKNDSIALVLEYRSGDYARALVAASGEGS